MSDLAGLYQEVIIDHGRQPRNFGELEGATGTAEGFNPLCGDQVSVHVKLADGRIADIAFQGAGCAISQASASLMTMALKGKSQDEALELFERVHAMLTEGPNANVAPEEVGKLAVLCGVWEFPMRVKCAILAWHTLLSALQADGARISTE